MSRTHPVALLRAYVAIVADRPTATTYEQDRSLLDSAPALLAHVVKSADRLAELEEALADWYEAAVKEGRIYYNGHNQFDKLTNELLAIGCGVAEKRRKP